MTSIGSGAFSLSSELTESLSSKEAAKLRAALCKKWGIENTSHKKHGSNFSGSQKLVDLIKDIVKPVTGKSERSRVQKLVIEMYRYDIDDGVMVSIADAKPIGKATSYSAYGGKSRHDKA